MEKRIYFKDIQCKWKVTNKYNGKKIIILFQLFILIIDLLIDLKLKNVLIQKYQILYWSFKYN